MGRGVTARNEAAQAEGVVRHSRGFDYCVGSCFANLRICSPLSSILIIRYVAAAKSNIIVLTLPYYRSEACLF